MKLITLLTILRGLEADLAELYDWLAKTPGYDPDAAALFGHLSLDEWEHVNRVDYQRKLVRSSPAAFGEVDAVIEPIEEARALVARIRSVSPPPHPTEAVILAWHFETCAAEGHITTAMRQANPGVASFLEALGRADRSHSELIESFARSRGIPISYGPSSTEMPAASWTATRGGAESIYASARHATG
jgi:hypothetical protein